MLTQTKKKKGNHNLFFFHIAIIIFQRHTHTLTLMECTWERTTKLEEKDVINNYYLWNLLNQLRSTILLLLNSNRRLYSVLRHGTQHNRHAESSSQTASLEGAGGGNRWAGPPWNKRTGMIILELYVQATKRQARMRMSASAAARATQQSNKHRTELHLRLLRIGKIIPFLHQESWSATLY